MDIYSIGEEKCIDGLWGRMVNGRFYTHTVNKHPLLVRKLDTLSQPNSYYATLLDDGRESVDYNLSGSTLYTKYTIKPINLKRGDIVWVKTSTKLNGDVWSPVVYLSTNPDKDGFNCNEIFDEEGTGIGFTARNYKEVFLKPPFNL